ncbi:glycosyltransferase family 9 protein [Pseudoalteromonas sp. OOF1S-7]|uniref:glycosyltransferase family 9 protein n=1 Tax=Pseudoalteromonas sp. OOF1S-7 TaxID=2917757 RepID=UPI001EF570DC|nr:glycosyltransferase family 9 protein [Pseudoalteromonas sp. OOF1S-7]MCG7535703.1 glycosyltransferase family 9 protein [Pseudoalteromonas sp. OOF1S-7]
MSVTAIDPHQVSGPILVVLPRYIGDAINTLPAIALLNELYPGKKIYLLVRPYMREVLERAHGYDFELLDDTRHQADKRVSLFGFARTLRAFRCSMAVLFRGSLTDAVLCKLARIRYVAGYAQNGRTPLLSHPLKVNQCHHYIFRYCRLVNDVHGKPFAQFALPRLKANTRSLTQTKSRTTGVYIGGKNKGSRHYPAKLAAQALLKIHQQSSTLFYLLGDPSEQQDMEELKQLLDAEGVQATNLAGKTSLGELVDTIAAMDVMITIDSGPMHIAAACQVPTLALSGLGTSPFSLVAPLTPLCHNITSQSKSLRESEIICAIEPQYLAEQYNLLLK